MKIGRSGQRPIRITEYPKQSIRRECSNREAELSNRFLKEAAEEK